MAKNLYINLHYVDTDACQQFESRHQCQESRIQHFFEREDRHGRQRHTIGHRALQHLGSQALFTSELLISNKKARSYAINGNKPLH
jgi:hypothetical protein